MGETLLGKSGMKIISCQKDFQNFLVLAFSPNWESATWKEIKKQFNTPKQYPCIIKYFYDNKKNSEDEMFPEYIFDFQYREDLINEYKLLQQLFSL